MASAPATAVELTAVRQVMINLSPYSDDDDEAEHKHGRPLGVRGSGSSSSSSTAGKGVRGGGGGGGKATQQTDCKLHFVKRLYGTGFLAGPPRPGAVYEVQKVATHLHHRTYPGEGEPLLTKRAATYDPQDPRLLTCLEEAREAHWRLAGTKGFKALQGIPELQQLLAYTAADVAHYAAGSGESGSASFPATRWFEMPRDWHEFSDPTQLWGEDSLIANLAPQLRLCLAADVATGLVCPSQPLTPDTPEHGAALLLFLGAALRHVQNECGNGSSSDGSSTHRRGSRLPYSCWAAGSIPDLRQLLDFYCAVPATSIVFIALGVLQSILQQQQQDAQQQQQELPGPGLSSVGLEAAARGLVALLEGGGSGASGTEELPDGLWAARAEDSTAATVEAAVLTARVGCGLAWQHLLGPLLQQRGAAPQHQQLAALAVQASLLLTAAEQLWSLGAEVHEEEQQQQQAATCNSPSTCQARQLTQQQLASEALEFVRLLRSFNASAAAGLQGAAASSSSAAVQQVEQASDGSSSGASSDAAAASLKCDPPSWFASVFQRWGSEQLSPLCLVQGLQQQQQQQQPQEAGPASSSSGGGSAALAACGAAHARLGDDMTAATRAYAELMRDAAAAASDSSDAGKQRRSRLLQLAGQSPGALQSTGATWQLLLTAQLNAVAAGVQLGTGAASEAGAAAAGNGTPVGRASGSGASSSGIDATIEHPQLLATFLQLVQPLVQWQVDWALVADGQQLMAGAREQDFTHLYALTRHQWRRAKLERRRAKKAARAAAGASSSKRGGRSSSQAAADSDMDASSNTGSNEDMVDELDRTMDGIFDEFIAAKCGSSSSSSSAPAANKAEAPTRQQQIDEVQKKLRPCPMCAHEEQQAQAAGGSSSGGGGGGGSQPPLYGSLPVTLEDPAMMRKLLWALLGRLKPSAQEFFRIFLLMCPHRTDVQLWDLVAFSIARHLWTPPGDQQPAAVAAAAAPGSVAAAAAAAPGNTSSVTDDPMALLLSSRFRLIVDSREDTDDVMKAEAAARRAHAQSLNAGFWQRDAAETQTAALLSLHALLALDPHGARVQPHPDLLYYTPAGFHAAASKCLLQHLVGESPAWPPPSVARTAGDGSPDPAQRKLRRHRWSDPALPAWYVWWHLGLVAYHQHRQGQQQQQQAQQEQEQPEQLQLQQSNGSSISPLVSPSAASQQLRPLSPQQPSKGGAKGKKQQQLGRSTRLANLSRSASSEPGDTPADAAPTDEAAVAGSPAAAGAGVSQEQCSSSARPSSSSMPVDMAALYADPDARLFAVGYAARQLKTRTQVERLLHNPPVPWGLQWSVEDWLAANIKPSSHCASCSSTLSPKSALCCRACGKPYCQLCSVHDCGLDAGATLAARRQLLRILGLLTPAPFSNREQQQQQQQQQQQLSEQSEQAHPAVSAQPPAAAAVAQCCIPNNTAPARLRVIMAEVVARRQQQREQEQQLFTLAAAAPMRGFAVAEGTLRHLQTMLLVWEWQRHADQGPNFISIRRLDKLSTDSLLDQLNRHERSSRHLEKELLQWWGARQRLVAASGGASSDDDGEAPAAAAAWRLVPSPAAAGAIAPRTALDRGWLARHTTHEAFPGFMSQLIGAFSSGSPPRYGYSSSGHLTRDGEVCSTAAGGDSGDAGVGGATAREWQRHNADRARLMREQLSAGSVARQQHAPGYISSSGGPGRRYGGSSGAGFTNGTGASSAGSSFGGPRMLRSLAGTGAGRGGGSDSAGSRAAAAAAGRGYGPHSRAPGSEGVTDEGAAKGAAAAAAAGGAAAASDRRRRAASADSGGDDADSDKDGGSGGRGGSGRQFVLLSESDDEQERAAEPAGRP